MVTATSMRLILRRRVGLALLAIVAFAASQHVNADALDETGTDHIRIMNLFWLDESSLKPSLGEDGSHDPAWSLGAENLRQARLAAADISGAVGAGVVEHTELACLTEALYFEARGESIAGQAAVAEVILNRVDSSSYPNSVCSVVRQGERRGRSCQFSYRCDGKSEKMRNQRAQKQVGAVAHAMLKGKSRVLTDDATHYHSRTVHPRWARKLVETARIGNHIFYRNPTRLSSR